MKRAPFPQLMMIVVLLGVAGLAARPPVSPAAESNSAPREAGHPGDPIRPADLAATLPPPARAVLSIASQVRSTTTQPPEPNWVLVKATSGRVTRISSPFRVSGRRTGRGPFVVGVGISIGGGPNPWRLLYVERLTGGSPTLAFAAGPAGHKIRVTLLEQRGTFELSPVRIEDDATVIALMVFVVNGAIDTVEWQPVGRGVPVSSSVRLGVGAAALTVSKPSKGVGVAAAGGGAGAGTYSRQVPAGIAGAIEWLSCQACVGTWTPPGGTAHTWVNLRHQAWPVCWCGTAFGFGGEFAGPAGHWKWLWTGVSASDHLAVLEDGPGVLLAEPVLAAYAPIGPDWILFSPCQSALQCIF